MSEILDTPPEQDKAGPLGSSATVRAQSAGAVPSQATLAKSGSIKSWFVAGLAALALVVSLWNVQQGRQDAQELAKRIQQQDSRLIESQSQSRLLQDSLRDAQAKLSVMESRVNEAASQQAQLEKLYRALSNDSLDVALADLESVILLAAQQAAAGGNLQGPLIGLQAAEAKLDRLADPGLVNLKRALSKDIERIKLMNTQDSAGVAQKLELISAQVDSMPLLSEPRANDSADGGTSGQVTAADTATKPAGQGAAPASNAPAVKPAGASQGFWGRILDVALGKGKVVGQDWRDLIRITRVDNPDAALLSPEQAYFVRENLRLRLLNARMALSSRQESVFKTDLERSRAWLGTYFDKRDKQVAQSIELLRQIHSARASGEAMVSFDSLAVVRTMRSLREAKK